MATIRDENISRDAAVARQVITLHRDDVAASQAAALIAAFRPGFPFRVVDVQHFTGAVAGVSTYDLRIGAASALAAAAAPVAATRGNAGLAADGDALVGDADDVLNLHVTTNGAGALTDLTVHVTIVPRDLDWRS